MRKRWLLLLPVLGGATLGAVKADNIWDRRDPRYANLFQDNRARSVGDILTVVISESTVTNERDQRQQSKTNGFNGAATVFGTPTVAETSGDFGRRFSGSAQLTSDRRFQDRLTVTVVDVMPNGNLVVEGYRSRVVAGEERVLRISGVVRVQDIGAGNAVQSTSLANAKVSYLGRGPESRAVNQNYGGRLMNRLWPF
jgi:flagellar L-ring protein precursor FlgH